MASFREYSLNLKRAIYPSSVLCFSSTHLYSVFYFFFSDVNYFWLMHLFFYFFKKCFNDDEYK